MPPYKIVLIYIPFNLLSSPCSTEDGIVTTEPLQTGDMHGTTYPEESPFTSPQPLPTSPEHYQDCVETSITTAVFNLPVDH